MKVEGLEVDTGIGCKLWEGVVIMEFDGGGNVFVADGSARSLERSGTSVSDEETRAVADHDIVRTCQNVPEAAMVLERLSLDHLCWRITELEQDEKMDTSWLYVLESHRFGSGQDMDEEEVFEGRQLLALLPELFEERQPELLRFAGFADAGKMAWHMCLLELSMLPDVFARAIKGIMVGEMADGEGFDPSTYPMSHNQRKECEIEVSRRCDCWCTHFGKRPRMACIPHSRNALWLIVKESCDRVLHHPLLYACQGVRYRRLEVILTTKIDKLGNAGETVKVAPGYFRNHLMPKLLAVPNIEKYAHLIREQRKIYQPVEEEEVKVVKKTVDGEKREYEKAARRLENARLVLKRLPDIAKLRSRESKDDPIHLRSPVTKEELVAEVARQLSVNIEPENLHLPTSMSTFGEYEVPLRLPRSIPLPEGKVQWTLNVKVRGK
ncbi:hypothetical protein JRO89_XS06G0061100 [Xanthoceras sorbifolium]|uniref:Large ribosomal subunit protein bL9c n=1 Tax=Xanthoceras sorbifolium TaxID=99658 RepID=A0ABQ8HWV6_9ROSI|nr:hypothetical protein JRO89_XS06G0061100 [Xanthoceras sorbifolium]